MTYLDRVIYPLCGNEGPKDASEGPKAASEGHKDASDGPKNASEGPKAPSVYIAQTVNLNGNNGKQTDI